MTILERAESEGVRGFLHPNECERLQELARGGRVIEIGAFCGLSAWCMAQTALEVVSVDTFKAATNGQEQMDALTTLDAFLAATSRFDNVQHLIGTSEEAADVVQGDFDLIFLDAMHTYEETLQDIGRWWPRVKNGGVLAIHDYRHDHWPGVEQAADEVFGPAPEGTTVVTLRWIAK